MITTLTGRPGRARPAARLAYVGAWLLLGFGYVALLKANNVPLAAAVRNTLAAILPNALLGRLSLALTRRVPSLSQIRGRHLALLVLAVLAIATVGTAGWLGLIALDGLLLAGAVRWPTGTIAAWQLFINTLLHATLAGIGYAAHAMAAVREAQDRAKTAEVLRARAELQLLRSQLNPHFVLNTLHALVGLVRRDPERAEIALERLGDLLKFGQWVHQSGADFVPLAREWEFVKSYLDLERIRLGDRLCVSLDAETAALQAPVPAFALQPLVENAILHAIAPRASGGRVQVLARRSGGRLHLAVEDDGPGASEAEIAESPRMGLRLLQERLATLYAGRARLVFESPPAGGFRVRLELPDARRPEVA